MNIVITWAVDGNSSIIEFLCDAIIGGITALATIVAPELIETDLFAGIGFEALCVDAAKALGARGMNETAYLLDSL